MLLRIYRDIATKKILLRLSLIWSTCRSILNLMGALFHRTIFVFHLITILIFYYLVVFIERESNPPSFYLDTLFTAQTKKGKNWPTNKEKLEVKELESQLWEQAKYLWRSKERDNHFEINLIILKELHKLSIIRTAYAISCQFFFNIFGILGKVY